MIRGIIAILKGMRTPRATAIGVALGAILGLMPKNNLWPFLFFILFFLTTVDKPAAVLSSLLFTPLGLLLDPLAHRIGLALLTNSSLQGFWSGLYNTPVIPWAHFNNTVVLGQLVLGIILFVPVFLLAKKLVTYYQQKLQPIVGKWKVVQSLKALRIYQWWDSIEQV